MNPALPGPHEAAVHFRRPRDRFWLHVLLLGITLWSVTAVGARLAYNFHQNRPALIEDDLFGSFRALIDPGWLAQGLPYGITLLTILLAHEMGHYLTCRYYGIHASLPYFLPAPTLIGTFGAFIRIRSAIFSKRQLFDVGVAGPLAGFAFVIPALAIGLAYSKVIPGIGMQGDYVFDAPLLQRVLQNAIFPGAQPEDIYLHPVARAAWVGLLATALNLLPVGQLDGGHIVYALLGHGPHRAVTRLLIGGVFLLGIVRVVTRLDPSWLIWSLLLYFLARRHPRIYDETPVGRGRTQLGVLSLAILIASFSATPVWIR